MPQSVCLTTALPLSLAVGADRELERDRARAADERQLALHGEAGRRRLRLHRGRAELDVLPLQDRRRRSSAGCSPCRRRRAPASRRCPRARGATSRPRRARCSVGAGPSPTSSVACQAVTWIRRSCPALAAAPVRPVRTTRVPFVGPERVRARLDRHARSLFANSQAASVGPTWPSSSITPSPPRSRSTRATRRSSTSSAWCRASREAACSRRPGRTRSRPRSRSRWARCR